MSRPDVEVVIPTWNGRDLVARCLETLAAQTVQNRPIVVDNGSEDGTAELVAERFPAALVVRFEENLGFARAVNAGIRAGSAEYVVLVNNDVECDPDFVERLVAPLRADPRVGMASGLLIVPGRESVDSYGVELDRTLAAFARFEGARYPDAPLDDRHLVGPCGGAAAYRRVALDGVGGFAEALFAYMEDVDLALRLRAAGWLGAGAPDAVAVHLGSATFGNRSRWQVETAAASRGYMLRKYGVLRSGVGTALWALAIELAGALLDAVRTRSLGALTSYRRGWRAADGERAHAPADAINEEIGLVGAIRRRLPALRSG